MIRIIFLFVLSAFQFIAVSQNVQKIYLITGTSTNDQAEKKFTYEQREWNLNGRTLIYNIDLRDKRYCDTLEIKDSLFNKISKFISDNSLLSDYEIQMNSNFAEKDEYREFIRADIISDDIFYQTSIKAEGYGQIEVNKVAGKLKDLEQIFYECVSIN